MTFDSPICSTSRPTLSITNMPFKLYPCWSYQSRHLTRTNNQLIAVTRQFWIQFCQCVSEWYIGRETMPPVAKPTKYRCIMVLYTPTSQISLILWTVLLGFHKFEVQKTVQTVGRLAHLKAASIFGCMLQPSGALRFHCLWSQSRAGRTKFFFELKQLEHL